MYWLPPRAVLCRISTFHIRLHWNPRYVNNLSDISNRRLQCIMEHVGNYNFATKHKEGQENKVCDTPSRLFRSLSGYDSYYLSRPPRLIDMSKKLAKHTKELEFFDPLVKELA